MTWTNNQYIFPNDYEKVTKNLFHVSELNNQNIEFIEVCVVNNKQVCINRSAVMKKLFANIHGQLFFEGKCNDLNGIRLFELVMPEHKIDGKTYNTYVWFLKVTGKSRHNFELECWRRESRTLWEGRSEITEFNDIFSESSTAGIKQMVIKRKVIITSILADYRDTVYIRHLDEATSEVGISYPLDLKLKHDGKKYSFECWCKNVIQFDLWGAFPEE